MFVYIRRPTVKPFLMSCSPEDTVGDMKMKVCNTEGISPCQQLFTNQSGRPMVDGKLKDYGIEDRHSIFLELLPSARDAMEIRVKMITGKIISISCSPGDIVDDIKNKLRDENGIPPHQQRLIYAGKQLEDSRTLKDYDIKDGAMLQQILRLMGGGCMFAGVGFNFASMKSGGKKQFSQNAPDYRIIGEGFNLEGRCINEKCEAFKQLAWSKLGFSRSLNEVNSLFETAGFNIGLLLHNTPCPLCDEPMDPDSIVSCGFYRCRYTFEGYQQGEKTVIKGSSKAEDYDGIEYHSGVMNSKTWTTLIIVVKPL